MKFFDKNKGVDIYSLEYCHDINNNTNKYRVIVDAVNKSNEKKLIALKKNYVNIYLDNNIKITVPERIQQVIKNKDEITVITDETTFFFYTKDYIERYSNDEPINLLADQINKLNLTNDNKKEVAKKYKYKHKYDKITNANREKQNINNHVDDDYINKKSNIPVNTSSVSIDSNHSNSVVTSLKNMIKSLI